jgi:predicted flap endonuclease-1-like 5' DNA nuclease
MRVAPPLVETSGTTGAGFRFSHAHQGNTKGLTGVFIYEGVVMASLKEIEGIGAAYAEKLSGAGLTSTEALLAAGATPKGRADLATKTGIGEKLVLRWVNMADLFRIKGVAEQYSDLLEAAGVDTVAELAQRKAENLQVKMVEVNDKKNLVRRVPTLTEVTSWVEQAKTLPRAVSY